MIFSRVLHWSARALLIIAIILPGQGRGQGKSPRTEKKRKPAAGQNLTAEEARKLMVDDEIVGAGVKNPRVIESMRATARHEFVPASQRSNSYYDMALPIGDGQTISPPFVVAYMTEAIDPQPSDKVLEIGTGSGYQAAVLSPLVREVYSIEIVEALGKRAEKTLQRLHYANVQTKVGDGYLGWPEHAPFDKIIVTCSPEKVPQALVDQLKPGGRMIVPVGERYQQTLYLLKKTDGKMVSEALLPTLFVPMTGKAEDRREIKPDPKEPKLRNGDFEEITGDPPHPIAWHYQRQLEVITAADAPSGKHYLHFHNEESGRGSQILQAFAIDGRYVHSLDMAVRVRCRGVKQGQNAMQLPLLGVAFYDENRGTITEKKIGPWQSESDWKQEMKSIEVPPRAREALVRIGLFGATGDFWIDDVQLKGQP